MAVTRYTLTDPGAQKAERHELVFPSPTLTLFIRAGTCRPEQVHTPAQLKMNCYLLMLLPTTGR